ncbi:type II toxin-antitoxin system VapC family toxin [Schaalia sp. ZJ1691]|uniref:type II toxin-antitoxin system VapC family toxin n=1 Tax=Schaalia sp. ZJ1691 TaxID=2709404 RepID=UPI0013EA5FAE|nr:type II toxin-antitoxin system VapC family toxin [Schaalia sp. ZJ1691]
MSYLLDTNVISALRVPHRYPKVSQWIDSISVADAYTSALNLAEIERGIVGKETRDPAQGMMLRRWFEQQVLPTFESRILSFDVAAARAFSQLRVPEHVPYDDALIASVAKANGLTMVTRNTRHFQSIDIAVINPWNEDIRGDMCV